MVQVNALTVFLCTLIVQMFYLFFFVYPESWTLRQNEETLLDASEKKGLKSWSKEGTVRRRQSKENNIAYYGHTMRKQGADA